MTEHFPIYMDYSATNPCDERVVDAMVPWLRNHFGNPASRSHAWGWEAEAAVALKRHVSGFGERVAQGGTQCKHRVGRIGTWLLDHR